MVYKYLTYDCNYLCVNKMLLLLGRGILYPYIELAFIFYVSRLSQQK